MSFFMPEQKGRTPGHEPMFLAPPGALILAAILIAVHVTLNEIVSREWANDAYNMGALLPARFASSDFVSVAIGAAGLLTHAFLHDGYLHLAVNCLWLLAAGGVVTRYSGGPGMFVLFALSAIAGGLAFVAVRWGGFDYAIGASGGVSGLLAAALRLHFGRMFDGGVAPIRFRPMLNFSIVYIAINLATGLWDAWMPDLRIGFAWDAHIGGYLAGLVLVTGLKKRPTAAKM